MPYETSYDAGLKPFNHDKHRGKWASPMDFFFACLGHAFKIDAMFVLPTVVFQDIGIYALIPYSLIMLVCTIPIIFMQSFLGQFSSTGFISVFRIAPIFKGLGYLSLAINITTLTYYSTFAAIPFFYFLHSLRPTLPWSCEGAPEWLEHHENKTLPCNVTNIEVDPDEWVALETPSIDFFLNHLNIVPWHDYDNDQADQTFKFSWPLILCTFVIWIVVWFILQKPTEMVGRILRYSTITMLAILGLCFLRFMFLPGAMTGIKYFFLPRYLIGESILIIPLMALGGLGSGWGSILTMASYNDFKNDITKQTWILCLGQFGLMMLGSLSWIFIANFLISSNPDSLYLHNRRSQWMQFMAIPTALSLLEMPHFWSLLFFGMLTVGAINLLVVQLFTVLTSLFDEYEQLRRYRKEVLRITIGALALVSILFCSNQGVMAFELIANYSILTQMFLNLLLLLVVLWIYGRERLQRDVHFMTNRTYSTWMVYVVRFVAPIFLLISFLLGLAIVGFESFDTFALFIAVTVIIVLPWLVVPGYCIFKMTQTTGLVGRRFTRCVRPTDWYPVDPDDRQRYEETFSNSEISHQLTTAVEEEA